MITHDLSSSRYQVVIYTPQILYRIVYGYAYINSTYGLFVLNRVTQQYKFFTLSGNLWQPYSKPLEVSINKCVKYNILILLMIFDLKQIFV